MKKLLIALSAIAIVVAGAGAAYIFITSPGEKVPGVTQARKVRDVEDDKKLPENVRMEQLAKSDPIKFLENCLRRYNRDVKTGYTATLRKQERIDGTLEAREKIDLAFRDEPHSVYMAWKEGARKAKSVVYVAGENEGMILVKPNGFGSFLTVKRDPEGADARKSGRYTLPQFGIKKGTQRTLAAWDVAAKDDALHVEYLGKKKIKEAGDRECFVLRRGKYKKPEDDGIVETTIYVDTETWLQVGSILKGENNKLIGEYFFSNIRLNPTFEKGQFTQSALK